MNSLEAVTYHFFLAYLVSFFGLTAWARREAGRPVWLLSAGTEPQALSVRLFRLAFAGAALWALLRAVLGHPFPGDPLRLLLDGVWTGLVGHALVAVGAMVAAASQMHMGASWRISAADGQVGAIVSNGPFARSRNPVFVGQVLIFGGLFLVFPGMIAAALLAALIVAIHLQIRIEERVLLRTPGAPYAAYCRSVGRWFGRGGS